MKLVADLYIRVSTDEQAEKGYSQRDQEASLKSYCAKNAIAIRKVIFEDYSAKTFEKRPVWSLLLSDYKRKSGVVDQVLFVKWDRFSRNAADAYAMIAHLRKCGIEPQAIEQPLDLSIPENKMMLAFYLAAPEVENDRRALNVKHGMRRARIEGRWMATAPIGYKNKSDENGRKYIAPREPQASCMKWAFETLATGTYPIDQVRKEMNSRGIRCSRSNFWYMVRNPVYCGKIFVPESKTEEACIVQGQHEPLVSETLFNEVQDVLHGRKKRQSVKIVSHEKLPLRGFLICTECGNLLTGSASKGRHQYYYYYHCQPGCKCRIKAGDANDIFANELAQFTLTQEIAGLVKMVIAKLYDGQVDRVKDRRKEILQELTILQTRLGKARELLLNGDIDSVDYKTIKSECEQKIQVLEAKFAEIPAKTESIESLLDKAFDRVCNIETLYVKATLEEKRKIIGSMYPEKLVFRENSYRTSRLNEAVKLIYTLGKDLSETKNRKGDKKFRLSGGVPRTGIEPALPCDKNQKIGV